jgi:signal transduction protein with GAF and PtsI domain
MNPQSIPAVKSMIRSLMVKDARSFVKEVLKETTTDGIIELVQDVYGEILSEKIYRAE